MSKFALTLTLQLDIYDEKIDPEVRQRLVETVENALGDTLLCSMPTEKPVGMIVYGTTLAMQEALDFLPVKVEMSEPDIVIVEFEELP